MSTAPSPSDRWVDRYGRIRPVSPAGRRPGGPPVPRFTPREIVLSLLRDAGKTGVTLSQFTSSRHPGFGQLYAAERDEVLSLLEAEGLVRKFTVATRSGFGPTPIGYRLTRKGGPP
jgi:DNA-binding PadR family transcriptional regulator